MSLESGLIDLITSSSSVTDVLNGDPFPEQVPQDKATPYCHYRVVNTRPLTAHDATAKLEQGTVRYTLFHENKNTAISLRDIIKGVVNCYKGTIGGETFEYVFYSEGGSGYDFERKTYSATFDLRYMRRVA